jgi:hypothetical protein
MLGSTMLSVTEHSEAQSSAGVAEAALDADEFRPQPVAELPTVAVAPDDAARAAVMTRTTTTAATPGTPTLAPALSVPGQSFSADSLMMTSSSSEGMEAANASLESDGAGQIRVVDDTGPMKRVEQEVIVEALYSYGNYKIFASGYDMQLYDAGVEYDRHSWGHFLKSQMDYVAEVLPFVLLDKPACTDKYGNPCQPHDKSKLVRQLVPGVCISPIGFRWQWLSHKRIRPYLEAKGGMLAFTHKVPATQASYENFSLQSAIGAQVMMNDRWGLRLGLFSDFHFSNAFIVDANPGLDVMNANLGVSYHF